eukprot:COSAG02_NODE_14369_length_1279_cov_1.975424_2_plen_57_part_00
MAAASPSAFGAAAAADATLHVLRGAAAKGIGPGAFVSGTNTMSQKGAVSEYTLESR